MDANRGQMMAATTPLVLDVEEAAQVLLGNVVLRPGGIPRVANMLQERARTMRGERRKAKARRVTAHVGRGKGKSGNFSISTERLGR